MFAGLKYALLVAGLTIILAVSSPLVVFVNDILRNPACLEIGGRVLEEINATHYVVELEVKYCSSVEAREVKIVLGDERIFIGHLRRGVKTVQAVVEREDIEEGLKAVEMNIAGIFRLKVIHR